MQTSRHDASHHTGFAAGKYQPQHLSEPAILQRLKETEEFLHTLIDAEPASVQLIAFDGTLLEVNAAGAAVLEAAGPEQLRGQSIFERIAPEHRHVFRAMHERVMAGSRATLEFELVSLRGSRRWMETHARPVRGGDPPALMHLAISRDITEHKRTTSFLCSQNKLLEQIATRAPLSDILHGIVTAIEGQMPDVVCTILLMEPDGRHLQVAAAPHVAPEYHAAIQKIPIGPFAGSCGTAAYRRQAVFVRDIATHPLWSNIKHKALPHGFRACWSTPIMSRSHGARPAEVLGTFACYLRRPALPDSSFLAMLGRAENLIRIALESERADKELRDSEAFLRMTQRTGRVGSWKWNLATDRVKWSEEMAHMHGIRLEDFDGTLAMANSFLHPDDSAAMQQCAADIKRDGIRVQTEYKIRRADGEIRYLWPAAEVVHDADGRPTDLMGVSIDITERIQSQEELRQSENRFRQLAESAMEGLMIHEQGFIRDANQKFAELYGFASAQKLIGKACLECLPLTPASKEIVRRQLESPRRQMLELEAEMPDGTLRILETQGRPIHYQGHDVRVVAVRDITERKSREKSLQLFRALIDRLNDAIEVIDAPTGRFLDVNDRGCQDLGYSREELLTLSVPDIDPLVSMADYQRNVEWLRAAGSITLTSQHRRRDGSCFPVEINARLVRLDREYILSVVRDISERMRYEEALRHSEERFRGAFEFSAISMGLVSLEGRWLKVNQALCNTLGYTAGELLASDFQSITHPDDLQVSLAFVRQLIEGTTPYCHFEKRYLHKQGRVIWVLLSASLVREAAGAPSYFICQLQDITHRKEAERRLAETTRSREELLALLDTLLLEAPIGLGFVSPDCRYLRCNAALAENNGVSAAEHQGRSVQEVVPHLWPQLEAKYRHVISGKGRLINQEVSGETAARPGVKRHWLATYYPVTIGAELLGVGLIVHEVTEQRRLEEQVRHAHKMEAVGRLAGGIAHDFNNLLTVVNGHSQLLLERLAPGDRSYHSLIAIREAGQRAASLVRQLLAFSRSQALQPVLLDLNELVVHFEQLFCRLLGDQIELVVRSEPELALVRADRSQIEQVLVNLVVNARDAMLRGGKLSIETSNVELFEHRAGIGADLKPGRYVRLSVTDTGHGMTAAVKARIFEPFFTTKETGKGTGLGLPAVHGIVQQSGGQIEVKSEIGVGSSIAILLPAESS